MPTRPMRPSATAAATEAGSGTAGAQQAAGLSQDPCTPMAGPSSLLPPGPPPAHALTPISDLAWPAEFDQVTPVRAAALFVTLLFECVLVDY